MSDKLPTKSEWKQLYIEAEKIKDLAPWQVLEEDMIFGVQNPETDDIGFVSIMGTLGEHLAIAVYLGDAALYDFWLVHQQQAPPEHILEVPQLQASFEDRNELLADDRNVIKSLGLKYRGRQAWPMFRSYRPGHVPWPLTGEEARYLTHVLAQTRNIVQRLQETPDLLHPPDNISYLVRVSEIGTNGEINWSDQMMRVPPPENEGQEVLLNKEMLEYVHELKPTRTILEVDFFLTPMQIQEKEDERARFGYLLLVVDKKGGMVLGFEIMESAPSFSDMLARVPQAFLSILAQNQLHPRRIDVQSPRTHALLKPVCDYLEIKLKSARRLPAMESAQQGLLSFLER